VHTGPDTLPFGDRLWALPISALWTPVRTGLPNIDRVALAREARAGLERRGA